MCALFQRTAGVEFFDRYLIHGLGKKHYDACVECDVFPFLAELKKSGKAKLIGFSFHDEADFLDYVLTEYPFFDFVQLQINYLDWTSPSIQSKLCYEVAVKHNKPIVVMEPVKGGTLASLPAEAETILRSIHPTESPATWAIRFVQTLPGVCTVLSGMNSMDQLRDNMRDLPPLNDVEQNALAEVRQIVQSSIAVACTGCRYCVDNCPMNIAIPDYFKLYNEYSRTPADKWYIQPVYDRLAEKHGKASSCIGCKQCESRCPQFLKITDYLPKTAEIFEGE